MNSVLKASLADDYMVLVGESSTGEEQIDSSNFPAVIGLELGDEVDSHYNNTYRQYIY